MLYPFCTISTPSDYEAFQEEYEEYMELLDQPIPLTESDICHLFVTPANVTLVALAV